jgi:probable F420-dependent oxidoreductase
VKVDGRLTAHQLPAIVEQARRHEAAGYDGLFTAENKFDALLPLGPAAEHTTSIELGTAVTIAFSRNPMQLAYAAHQLQEWSGGRLVLGLGSQVKAHIERRFSMPWSQPAARMGEFVSALRSIWASWDSGQPLAVEGEFYRHTLMPPFFCPPPNPTPPKVYVAAVGEYMTRVAGEVADGLLTHAFSTPRYLREVTLPTLAAGAAGADRDPATVAVSYLGFVATGPTEEAFEAAKRGVREQIAFYGSTPAYRGVLDLHGWGDLHTELHALSRSGDAGSWRAMGDLIDDQILNEFAVVAEPDAVAKEILARFAGVVDRFSFDTPYETDIEFWDPIVAELRAG